MQRRLLAWVSPFPLVALGSLAAHSLAYRLAEPDAGLRRAVLDGTGHGYLAYLPLFLATGLALLLAGLVGHAVTGFCRRPGVPPAWPLALVPPLAFTLQEHLERLAAWGHLPLTTALEPTFLIGLALQLPFAVAALLVARLLTGAAEAFGRALASPPSRPVSRPPAAIVAVYAFLPALAVPSLRHAGRAPPS
jgi:hypothetical protein